MASGSSSNQQTISVTSDPSLYPYFKAFHRPAPDDSLASKQNHIEQNFYNLKRNKQTNRSEYCECHFTFCSILFKKFSSLEICWRQQTFKSSWVGLRLTQPKTQQQANVSLISGPLHHNLKVQRIWHHWPRSCGHAASAVLCHDG